MSLVKQLYILVSILFLVIFIGNFAISLNNTKEYLQLEATTKAQDASVAIGMMVKPLLKNKQDPEIESIIKAVSDSGFYQEIRFENAFYSFNDKDLIKANHLDTSLAWKLSDVKLQQKVGELVKNEDDSMAMQLQSLENLDTAATFTVPSNQTYVFNPSKNFQDGQTLDLQYKATDANRYLDLSVKLPLSKVIFTAKRDVQFDSVPEWFINVFHINIEEQKHEISDGWKTSALIVVKANAGIAYAKLYEQMKSLLLYTLIAYLIVAVLLQFFLKLLLKPLNTIEQLAEKISLGFFEQIENLPWTKELKSVSIAMNTMSQKIKQMIAKLNCDVDNISKKLEHDVVTGLPLKQTFDGDLKELFLSKKSGYIFFFKISNLMEFSKIHNIEEVNNYLTSFASLLSNIEKSKAYRFYGAEFAILINEEKKEQIINLLTSLKKEILSLSNQLNIDEICHTGVIHFNSLSNASNLLLQCNEAYEMARRIGPNEYFIKEQETNSRDKQQWQSLIEKIIDEAHFNVNYIGDIYDLNTNNLISQEAFTQILDQEGNIIPIGTFISIAEEHNKVVDFDKAVIHKVLEYIKTKEITHQICINLSFDSISDVTFMTWLSNQMQKHQNLTKNIIFSLTAYSVAKHAQVFKSFTEMTSKMGVEVMIKRFETKFISLEELKILNPNSIRLSRDFTTDMANNEDKKKLVDSIVRVTQLYNIKVYGENVYNNEDYSIIKQIGLNGASK